jgi:hypothetical protein
MGVTFVMVMGAALAGVTLGLMWAGRRSARPEPYLAFRCPACTQKVRYLASKAGRPGMCPRCNERWVLPTNLETAPDPSPRGGPYPLRVGARLSRPAR